MRFSIITVCLNAPRLKHTCESIVNQTFQDFEWIVIDGGSAQPTQDVFAEYKCRMDCFVSEKDDGIYDAMNKGIARARGEWLNFMNAGDSFYNKGTLKFVAEQIDKTDEKSDIFYGDDIIKKQNGIFERRLPWRIDKYYMYKASIGHQAAFIAASAFRKIGPYDIALRISSDYKWFLLALKHDLVFKKIMGYPLAIMDGSGIGSQFTSFHLEERKYVQSDFFSQDELSAFQLRLNNERRLIAVDFIAGRRKDRNV
jgi:glycosyltransferase involved in cell wall biosynthesis